MEHFLFSIGQHMESQIENTSARVPKEYRIAS